MMKKDIFANPCCNPLIFVLIAVVIIANFLPKNIAHIIEILFFFTLGALCFINFRQCGRIHCKFTSYGFIGVGVIALLAYLEIINIAWNTVWIIFWIALIIAYLIEFYYKGKTGSCYHK